MQTYIYTTQRGRVVGIKQVKEGFMSDSRVEFIGGCVKARDSVEAYKNARLEVAQRKGIVAHIIMARL